MFSDQIARKRADVRSSSSATIEAIERLARVSGSTWIQSLKKKLERDQT